MQQLPVTYVYATPVTQTYPAYPQSRSLKLGVAQVVFGSLLIVLQIVIITYHSGLFFVGEGIWTATFMIIAGAFGIASGKSQYKCPIITCMVMSILAAVFTSIPISLALTALLERYSPYGGDKVVWAHVLMLIVSILELVAAVWASVLCCKGACCGPSAPSEGIPVQLQYISSSQGTPGNQPMVFMTPTPTAGQMQPGAPMYPTQGQQFIIQPGAPIGVPAVVGDPMAVRQDSMPPAYESEGAGSLLLAQGNAPPVEEKTKPVDQ